MRSKLFLAVVLAFDLSLAGAKDIDRIDVDFRFDASTLVFVGREKSMPVDGTKIIALAPKRDKAGKVVKPSTLKTSIRLMYDTLPSWYIAALRRTSDDSDCDVQLNGVSVTSAVNTWFIKNWDLMEPTSQVYIELRVLGLPHDYNLIDSAISFGFCNYVRTRDDAASIEVIAKYARKDALFPPRHGGDLSKN